MDTIIILGSLMGLGYFLNQEKQTRNNPPVRNIVEPHDVPNSYNIYEGNMVNVVREHEQGLGNDLFKKSKNAKETRIIPPLYNLGNPTSANIKKKSLGISTRRGLGKRRNQPTFPKDIKLENREDYDPLVVGVYNQESGGFNKVIDESFTHQNMVPFYSGNSTNQNMQMNSENSILERFTATGTGSLLKPGKKEADNFFKPEKNPNVFTTDLPDDDTRTRYHVSELKTDQLPFEQQRIGPGLNEGFNDKGVDGFHPMFRPPQQSVDELRVLTDQKETYGGRLTSATPFAQERAMQSTMKKNQPERTFEQLSFISATPTGVSTRHKNPENFQNLPNTARSQEHDGGIPGRVGGHNIEKNIVISEYNDPSKTPQETYDWGSIKKPTSKSVVYDESDLPRVTRKETTSSSYIGTVNQSKGKGYLTTTYLAPTTTKETTQTSYTGIAEGSEQQMSQQQYYNAEINAMKETTLVNRDPTTVKEQLFYGKEDVNQVLNHNVRHELQEDMAKYKNVTSIYSQEPLTSRITHQKDVSKCLNDRINPIFTEQVRQNPFSHSLN